MSYYHCLLCPDDHIVLDDVSAGPTTVGGVICNRCWAKDTNTILTLTLELREKLRQVLTTIRHNQKSEIEVGAAYCLTCGDRFDDPMFVHDLGEGVWMCLPCWDQGFGEVFTNDPDLLHAVAPSPLCRCVICDGSTRYEFSSPSHAALGLCPSCYQTPLGMMLGNDTVIRYKFLRSRGLMK